MTDGREDAREDWSLLHAVTGRLNAAETMAATLQALAIAAPAAAEAEVCLWTIDCEADGTPSWLTAVGVLPAAGQPARGQPGARHSLPELPSGRIDLESPGVPVLIASIADDPRVDATARARWASLGVAATISMSLLLRGRLVGLLTIDWPRPVELGPRERRIYQALAGHAALLLEHQVMALQQRALLAESQRERRLLSTVMDHVPVGILCIDGPTRRPLLTNRMARLMLAGSPDEVSEPLPLSHMLHPGTNDAVDANDLAGVRAALTGQTQTRDLDLLPAGGTRISVETIGVPVRDVHGNIDRVVVVLTDITGRKQAAEERVRLQDEVIQAQAAALVERSTPLIPITDDVLVMPLIGTIDRARGHGILEVALQGARDRRARVTILDITGVPTIDQQAAEVLLKTAQALRLLGVVPVLSGVRPAVAQALVGLDVPLAGIVTCGSLQAGIEYAMRQLGRRS
jgi:anti-anti-sigma regulatory factor/PAS domain-containing protein